MRQKRFVQICDVQLLTVMVTTVYCVLKGIKIISRFLMISK